MKKTLIGILTLCLVTSCGVKAQKAVEITNPDGYINTEKISLADLKGKAVVLLDFWTYSCINCQRTFPYLNAWYAKYKDKGLVIIGVHTPEFEFEKKYENVLVAAKKFQIKYPIVLNNNHSTWNAYGDLYWPREALININGDIVATHIGEGNYDETERNIQAALEDRKQKLGLKISIPKDITSPKLNDTVDTSKMQSPEIYFGAGRNDYLGIGESGQIGPQNLIAPAKIEMNKLYLVGDWKFENEYAENMDSAAKIIFKYRAKYVYLVANAKDKTILKITRDGKPLANEAGADVKNSKVTVRDERLYRLINDQSGYGEHTIEITIEKPGLKAFTFTFG